MENFIFILDAYESDFAMAMCILLFIYAFFFFKYIREIDENISIFQVFNRDESSLSPEVLEHRKNFWKKTENPSINKKLAKFFLFLPISLSFVFIILYVIAFFLYKPI